MDCKPIDSKSLRSYAILSVRRTKTRPSRWLPSGAAAGRLEAKQASQARLKALSLLQCKGGPIYSVD